MHCLKRMVAPPSAAYALEEGALRRAKWLPAQLPVIQAF